MWIKNDAHVTWGIFGDIIITNPYTFSRNSKFKKIDWNTINLVKIINPMRYMFYEY